VASNVPVKDLRPILGIVALRDKLAVGELRADLRSGARVAWWKDWATGEYHEVPRSYWWETVDGRCTVEMAIVRETYHIRQHAWAATHRQADWPALRNVSTPPNLFHRCTIYVAARVKHAGGKTPEYDWDAAYGAMRDYVREHGLPKKKATLASHIKDWFAKRDQFPADSLIRGHVSAFFADNSVTGKKHHKSQGKRRFQRTAPN
jgi:hypothetical protein